MKCSTPTTRQPKSPLTHEHTHEYVCISTRKSKKKRFEFVSTPNNTKATLQLDTLIPKKAYNVWFGYEDMFIERSFFWNYFYDLNIHINPTTVVLTVHRRCRKKMWIYYVIRAPKARKWNNSFTIGIFEASNCFSNRQHWSTL